MSSLVGGTGIIGQDMVCGFGNGKYKTFEGTEISIENCVKARAKDLKVEGKTYQNLVSNLDELVGKVYTLKNNTKVIANLLKINTTYTFVISLSEANYSDTNFGAIIVVNYPTLSPSYINISRKNGIFKIKYTVKEEIPKSISISPHANNDTSSSFKLENLIILEGDYTNIDIPNNINGIESVTEKENNVLSAKINDNTTTLNLPIPLRSLPNGTCDTIEGNRLVQRVGRVVLDGLEGTGLVWQVGTPYDNNLILYHVMISSWNGKGNNILVAVISDKFVGTIDNGWQSCTIKNSCFMNTGGKIHFLVSKEEFPTSTDFDNWLKNNSTTIYYPLATPIIHSLETPQLATVKGTNTITTTNNIKPKMTMKVKVKK